jgi:signal transduction histidine kinase
MTSLINELLDLAHIYRGQTIELIHEPIDLVAHLQLIVSEQQQTTRKHKLTLETSQKTLFISGDSARLERVFTNLLSNAIKYDPSGNPIIVSLSQAETPDSQQVIITVRDQGLGIPADDLAHIFEPFHRARNITGKIRGSGLGLASAYQIVERHGGSIEVESTPEVGSTFTIRLPINTDMR